MDILSIDSLSDAEIARILDRGLAFSDGQPGQALAGRGQAKAARRTLLPVAKGPYESPEKPKAKALLEGLKVE